MTIFGSRLSPRRLKAMVGREVGLSDWFTVTQERIDAFAAATGVRQWIHVDPDRAARSPLGGTVAHGFLLLSLVPFFNARNEVFTGRFRMAINYGLDRVRFPHAVGRSRPERVAPLVAAPPCAQARPCRRVRGRSRWPRWQRERSMSCQAAERLSATTRRRLIRTDKTQRRYRGCGAHPNGSIRQ